jgi:uncharacterized membrane protein YeaQ/YmgE (transglycosylase-associated protein family)
VLEVFGTVMCGKEGVPGAVILFHIGGTEWDKVKSDDNGQYATADITPTADYVGKVLHSTVTKDGYNGTSKVTEITQDKMKVNFVLEKIPLPKDPELPPLIRWRSTAIVITGAIIATWSLLEILFNRLHGPAEALGSVEQGLIVGMFAKWFLPRHGGRRLFNILFGMAGGFLGVVLLWGLTSPKTDARVVLLFVLPWIVAVIFMFLYQKSIDRRKFSVP